MLLRFDFSNYMSFGNECKFNMFASKDKAHSETLLQSKNDSHVPVSIIYGANASGKSSFIKALNYMQWFLAFSSRIMPGMHTNIMPFKFRENAAKIPSLFAVSFVKDDIEYNYSFVCNREAVKQEKLSARFSSKFTTIFERNEEGYKFSASTKRLNELKDSTHTNQLFLATLGTWWNNENIHSVVDYLLHDIIIVSDIDAVWGAHMLKIERDGEIGEYKKFCLDLLSCADIGIADFSIETKKVKEIKEAEERISALVRALTRDNVTLMDNVLETPLFNFRTYHDVNDNGKKSTYSLDIYEESYGTFKLFKMSPIIYNAMKRGALLVIDEIDRSLHPLLVAQIIKMFLDKSINKNGAQLIANTHDTNLMDLELLRRDEIWFMERDHDTGISEIYRLSDFSPRAHENIEKGYLLGRFGAIPFIKD